MIGSEDRISPYALRHKRGVGTLFSMPVNPTGQRGRLRFLPKGLAGTRQLRGAQLV